MFAPTGIALGDGRIMELAQKHKFILANLLTKYQVAFMLHEAVNYEVVGNA